MPDEPEVQGLLALMLLVSSRRDARTGDGGELIPLADQDRGRWTATRSPRARPSSAAACAAASPAPTSSRRPHQRRPQRRADRRGHRLATRSWPLRPAPGPGPEPPVVALNRAVALAEVSGPEAALARRRPRPRRLPPVPRDPADLLRRLGRDAEAVAVYQAAIARSGNATERAS